jgi:formylglycine-generating enzyme
MRRITGGRLLFTIALALTGALTWLTHGLTTKNANSRSNDERVSRAPTLGSRQTCEGYDGLPELILDDEHSGMVWVKGGSFIIGSRHGYLDERPASEATPVAGFWIDRTEVTNAQFAAFVNATGYVTEAEREGFAAVFEPPVTLMGTVDSSTVDPSAGDSSTADSSTADAATTGASSTGSAPNWWRRVEGANWRHPDGPASSLDGRDNHPVVQVTHADADAYAQWRGRSLPTEVQWEFAARSGGAPDDGSAPLDEAGRPTANFWQGTFPSQNVATDGYTGRAPVGCYAANRLGVYDMIGNVWELTRDPYRGQRPAHCTGNVDGPRDLNEEPSVIKGGSFLCAPSYCARYRASARHPHEAHLAASHVGFRTVR